MWKNGIWTPEWWLCSFLRKETKNNNWIKGGIKNGCNRTRKNNKKCSNSKRGSCKLYGGIKNEGR